MTTMPEPETIDDIDVFDDMRRLLDACVDLTNRAAVEEALSNHCYAGTRLAKRYVDWCIKAAQANQAAGGLRRHAFGCDGFVPPE